jgi:hypothetical protein
MPSGYDEQGQCRDLRSLIELAISRGYSSPERWAQWVIHSREMKARKRARSTRHLMGKPRG